MFSGLDPQWSKPSHGGLLREAAKRNCEQPKPVPVKSIEVRMEMFFCECASCFGHSGRAFDKVAALTKAEKDGWLWNGEDVWCPDCLERLSEDVP